jgi:hypothetical protein
MIKRRNFTWLDAAEVSMQRLSCVYEKGCCSRLRHTNVRMCQFLEWRESIVQFKISTESTS